MPDRPEMDAQRQANRALRLSGGVAVALVALTLFIGVRSFSVGRFHPDWQGWIFLAVVVPLIVAAPFCVIYLLETHFRAQDERDRARNELWPPNKESDDA